MALDWGYCYLDRTGSNPIQIPFKKDQLFIIYDPKISDLPEEQYVSIELGRVRREIVLRDVFFRTTADAELFLDKINTLNGTGGFSLELRVSSSAIPGSFFNFLSGKNSITVLCITPAMPLEKIAYGDGTVWKITQMKFRQSAKFV